MAVYFYYYYFFLTKLLKCSLIRMPLLLLLYIIDLMMQRVFTPQVHNLADAAAAIRQDSKAAL